MVECSFCGRTAVYINSLTGDKYCAVHFLEHFDRKVRKTIRRYGLFGDSESIVVATSGGKDSLSLLHYLHGLSRRVPGWRVSALLVDEGIKNYREHTISDFLRVVSERGIPHKIVSFKEYFGYTLDEIVEIGRKRGLPYKPCSYCGVFRRYLLNKVSREMGASALATAHNLDDTVQTFLLNIIRNSWDRVARLGPITGIIEHPLFVKRVKPFIELLDKETAIYALMNGLIKPEFHECPYVVHNVRVHIRKYVNELEERYPGTKYQLLRSMLQIVKVLSRNGGEASGGAILRCRVCGELSSHPICRACQYRYELGIMESREEEVVEGFSKRRELRARSLETAEDS